MNILVTVLLSLKVGFFATVINLPFALFVSYIMARKQFKGKQLIDGFINLPLVMPPVTTGFLLLLIFGKNGLLGAPLYLFTGLRIAFTEGAAILSSMVVSFPLITRSLRVSMEMVDPKLEKAAMTLGAGRFETFIRVIVPLIIPGIISGSILGFARSLGEFGATITFAGNILGETRTIPLSVYTLLQIPGRGRDAMFLVAISIFISFLALFSSSTLNKKYNNWRIINES
ncbi:MAG: molybdate ABC transporter permease subunit [Spirochaetaceae bacterium]